MTKVAVREPTAKRTARQQPWVKRTLRAVPYGFHRLVILAAVLLGVWAVTDLLPPFLSKRPETFAGLTCIGFWLIGIFHYRLAKARVRTELIVDLSWTCRKLIRHQGYEPDLRSNILRALDEMDSQLAHTPDPEERKGLKHHEGSLTWRFLFFGPPDNPRTLVWSDDLGTFTDADMLLNRQLWHSELAEQPDAYREPFLTMAFAFEKGFRVYRLYLKDRWAHTFDPITYPREPQPAMTVCTLPIALLMDPSSRAEAHLLERFGLRRSDSDDDADRVYENDYFKFAVRRL